MISNNGEISLPLRAASYTSLNPRTGDKSQQVDNVRRELNKVANALPTQIRPDERKAYLDAIMEDLNPVQGAVWTTWPDDLYLLALTCIKSLARNPVGSETLLTTQHLSIINYHSALPFFPDPRLDSTSETTIPPTFITPTLVPPHPRSPQALEALRVIANVLVLHPAGRRKYAAGGGGVAIARALAGYVVSSGSGDEMDTSEESPERLFLLGRIGFLLTVEKKSSVVTMVDEHGIVESIVYHLSTTPVIQSNYDALSELLKLAYNILRFYPSSSSSSTSIYNHDEPWNDRLEPLLYPILTLTYLIPFSDLSPPLTHAIHALLAIPFTSSLISTWHSVPDTRRRSVSSLHSPHSGASISGSTSPLVTPVRVLISKISHMSTSSSSSSSSATSSPRKLSTEVNSNTNNASLALPRAISPATLPSPVSTTSGTHMSLNAQQRRAPSPLPCYTDPTVLPDRIINILMDFFKTYLPNGKSPDESLQQGPDIDEVLPPVFLLLARAASGSAEIREHLKDKLLPANLDRSPEAGSLESRKTLLGDILRLMGSSTHFQARDTAGELMWAVCGEDAADLSVEIGYGNAAGLLFRKGISGPPPAKIVPITDDDKAASKSSRHPITGLHQPLVNDPSSSTTAASGSQPQSMPSLAEMTEEEKEREAELLFTLFDRLEKNPILSAGVRGANGESKPTRMVDVMRGKVEEGEVDRWDREDEEREKKEREEEEKREEEEAIKELQAYKKRTGRS